VTPEIAREALAMEAVDERGLDELDRKFLRTIVETYGGGPAGIEAIAATLNEEVDTLVDMVEPYLLKIGFIGRTRQGRIATAEAYKHLGLKAPPAPRKSGKRGSPEPELFAERE
jgi:Holliday junction DNA helicase RuvB